MSLNVYNMAESIEYEPGHPNHYYGFAISWSGDFQTIAPFSSPEQRELFCKAIADLLPDEQREDSYWSRVVPALIAWERHGLGGIDIALEEEEWFTPELADALRERAEKFQREEM